MMNYLSYKVRVGLDPTNLNMFVGLVSPYGKFFKSSSCQLAMGYFNAMGCLQKLGKDVKAAEGRVMVTQAGSPEGFGLLMQRVNAKNAIMYNDELGLLVSKAGIEGSSFGDNILIWHGSGDIGNNVTSTKSAFHFSAKSYTFGWLWATTDRGFNRHWPKLAGISSGLEDRMFFVISPENPKPTLPYSDPNIAGCNLTRQRIDSAVKQESYDFEDKADYVRRVSGMDPRSMALVQVLALYFAIDLGLGAIDSDCIGRAMALVEYRNQVAAFLAPIEADNKEGRLQKEMIREVRQSKGKISYRDLCQNLDYTRHGLFEWGRAYKGLLGEKILVEFHEQKTAGKRAIRMVGIPLYDGEG
jgi:hypothetical protein